MKSSLTYQQRVVFGATYLTIGVLTLIDTQYHFQAIRYPFELLLKPWHSIEIKLRSITSAPAQFIQTTLSSEKIIADLQIKNAQLQVKVGEAEFAKKENEILKQELEKRSQTPQDTFKSMHVARVVSAGPMTYLDKGISDGVRAGGLVMSQEILLGKVQTSTQFFSNAVTFSQGSWQTVAQTQGGIKGVITGKKNEVFFTQVSADEKLEKGDQLFTVGSVGDGIPSGLYIGQIKEKIEEVGAPVQTALVDQAVSIETVPIVLIKMRE